jgi:hypothetical protein
MALTTKTSTDLFDAIIAEPLPSLEDDLDDTLDLTHPPTLQRQQALPPVDEPPSLQRTLLTPSMLSITTHDTHHTHHTHPINMTLRDCIVALINVANQLQLTDLQVHRFILAGIARQLEQHADTGTSSSTTPTTLTNVANVLRTISHSHTFTIHSIRAAIFESVVQLQSL